MRIAIMGSGGVGGWVGARLQAAGEEVVFIARGAHRQAMHDHGLRLEHPTLPLHLPRIAVTDDPATVGPVDLVIFSVKLADTESAARLMRPLVGAGTRVLTLQNGIDSVSMIRRHVDGIVLAGVIYISAHLDGPGVVRSPGGFHAIVADAAGGDPVMAALAEAAARGPGLEVRLSPDIDTVVWEKFAALSSVSGSTALLRATMGEILGHPETKAFLRQLVDEAVSVAAAAGHALKDGFADQVMGQVAAMPASFRSSMAEDLAHGRRLELPWLSGRVHALGQALHVPTPAHDAVFRGLVLHVDGQQRTGS